MIHCQDFASDDGSITGAIAKASAFVVAKRGFGGFQVVNIETLFDDSSVAYPQIRLWYLEG